MAENRKVLPAYAGMIPRAAIGHILKPGAPRIRGDDPSVEVTPLVIDACSPHTRG